jgi:sortase A
MAKGQFEAGLRAAECLAWGLGLALLLTYVAVRAHGAIQQRQAMRQFDDARAASAATLATPRDWTELPPDHSLWSDERLRAYEQALDHDTGAPLAVLRIPGIDLEVAVLDGTDEVTLNRAVGRIEGTARLGEAGNVGIAGHRDGFFRGLKDVSTGDVIELETLGGIETYEVTQITIVDPSAIDVLDPTPQPAITLVTCYPFYFVGSAPERYIVRATRVDEGESREEAETSTVARATHTPQKRRSE